MISRNVINKLGFTLMELLIAIAIVAILAAIAIPTYLHYTKRAYYNEVVQTGNQYKSAVEKCLSQRQGKLADCDAGKYGIPADITSDIGQVGAVTVKNSVITITPNPINGIKETDTYVLIPQYSPTGITWSSSGGACSSDLAPNC